jgi:hypothetical protein
MRGKNRVKIVRTMIYVMKMIGSNMLYLNKAILLPRWFKFIATTLDTMKRRKRVTIALACVILL